MKTAAVERLRSRIFIRALVALVVTGVVLTLAVALPLHSDLKDKNTREIQFLIDAKVASVNQFVSKLVNVAEQVTSRTQIREKLIGFNQGKVSKREWVDFTRPKLRDAMKKSADAVGITRLDTGGAQTVGVGVPLPRDWLTAFDPDLQHTRVYNPVEISGRRLIAVASPILDGADERVGTDIVLFEMETLHRIVEQFGEYDTTGEVSVFYRSDGAFAPMFERKATGFETCLVPALNDFAADRFSRDKTTHPACPNSAVGIRPIAQTDWLLLFRIDRDELNAIVDDTLERLLLSAALILFFGLIGVYLLTAPLLKRLAEELKARMTTVEELRRKSDLLLESRRALETDIEKRKRAEAEVRLLNEQLEQRVEERTKELERKNKLLQYIDQLRRQFIREPDPFLLFPKLLDQLLELTNSEFGLIGDVLADPTGKPYLVTYALSNLSWDDETRALYEECRDKGFEFRKLDNLFGLAITSGRPVLSNETSHDPRGAGFPKGHPRIDSFLGIPVYFGEKVVGEVGLANRPGGYDPQILEWIAPLIDALGQIIAARWEQKARLLAEQELRASEERYKALFHAVSDAVFVHRIDPQSGIPAGPFVEVNESACRRLGYTMEELLHLAPEDIDASETPTIDENLTRYDPDGNVVFERIHVAKNGRRYPVEIIGRHFEIDGKMHMLSIARDLTERKKAEQALEDSNRALEEEKRKAEELARTDPLTGLHNRRAFFEFGHALEVQARRYGRVYSVIMLDVDHFKRLNDRHGHALGDAALIAIAETITEVSRSADFAARMGGEEFAIILPETRRDRGVALADRLRSAFSRIDLMQGADRIAVTASFGVAESGDQSPNLDQVIRNADQAMYRAKQAGRNRVAAFP